MKNTLNGPWTLRSVQDSQDFFARHGEGLSDVLYVVGGEAGLDLFCDVKDGWKA